MSEDFLGVPVSKAVISVPAEFDERQRNYTIKAASLAGDAHAAFHTFLKLSFQRDLNWSSNGTIGFICRI